MLTSVISHIGERSGSTPSRRACLVALVAIAIGGGACRLKSDSEAPKAVAPAFTLADEDGKPTSLTELTRSGHAVLVFYRGHW